MTITLFQLGLKDSALIGASRARAGGDAALTARVRAIGRELGVALAVLSTCERFEVYAMGQGARLGTLAARAGSLLADPTGDVQELHGAPGSARIMERRVGRSAAAHLFAVAAGLDSRFVGEEHILGQVTRAEVEAVGDRRADVTVRRMIQSAVASARSARTRSGLSTLATSCTDATIAAVAERARSHDAKRVVILGGGMLARELFAAMRAFQDLEVSVVARHVERANVAFGGSGVRILHMSEVGWATSRADVVIGATSSPGFLLDASHVSLLQHARLLIDLGVPANIDPALADAPGVRLVTLADLLPPNASAQAVVAAARAMTDAAASRWAARWLTDVRATAAADVARSAVA